MFITCALRRWSFPHPFLFYTILIFSGFRSGCSRFVGCVSSGDGLSLHPLNWADTRRCDWGWRLTGGAVNHNQLSLSFRLSVPLLQHSTGHSIPCDNGPKDVCKKLKYSFVLPLIFDRYIHSPLEQKNKQTKSFNCSHHLSWTWCRN